MKIALAIAVSMIIASGCKTDGASDVQSVEDIVTLNRNDDGTFRVMCLDATDGSTYTEPNVTSDQIRNNAVCLRNQTSPQYRVEFFNNVGCNSLIAISRFSTDSAANDNICTEQANNFYVRSVRLGNSCHDLVFNDIPFRAACKLVQPFNDNAVEYFNDAQCAGKLVATYSFPESIASGQTVCTKATEVMSHWGTNPYVRAVKQGGVCYDLVYNNLVMSAACQMAQARRGQDVVGFFNQRNCKNLIGMVDASSPADANYGADRCAALTGVVNNWSSNPYVSSVFIDGACRVLTTNETIETACPRYALTSGGGGDAATQ